GIVENLPRVLPNGLGAKVQRNAIKIPKIFDLIAKSVEQGEMDRTFNCGVGMVLVVPKDKVDYVLANSDGYIIGQIIKGSGVEML
ncbi:MAG: phosphoribosylformylglycinamidine cyclo-ligase, partial [Campylobacter sp.]|nr:phosphoribosylformylglycinamidine cyclo-ligase [Campylobacter sp.]